MQAEHDMDNLRPVDVLSKGERDRERHLSSIRITDNHVS